MNLRFMTDEVCSKNVANITAFAANAQPSNAAFGGYTSSVTAYAVPPSPQGEGFAPAALSQINNNLSL